MSSPQDVATRVLMTSAPFFYNQSSLLMLEAQESTTGLKEPVMSRNETNRPLKHVKANAGPTFNRYCCLYLQQLHYSYTQVMFLLHLVYVCKMHLIFFFSDRVSTLAHKK